MKCECAEMDSCVAYGESEQDFSSNCTLISQRPSLRLYQCNHCLTYWQLDVDDRSDFAIKVSEPEEWSSFDDMPYRKAFFTKFHGGESDRPCIYALCRKLALEEMAICVEHAYPEFSADSSPR